MRDSVSQAFKSFNTTFEGYLTFMYGDVKNLVTTGMGNLVDPVSAALSLPWVNADGSASTQQQITDAWNAVKARTDLNQKGGAAYSSVTTIRLTDAGIDQLIQSRLQSNETTLRSHYSGYDSWPADAQLGIHSMAWAMGPAFKFPKFAADVNQDPPDFTTAATDCQMNAAGNPGLVPRNTANNKLFLNAAAVLANKADPDTLYYPGDVPAGASTTTTAPASTTTVPPTTTTKAPASTTTAAPASTTTAAPASTTTAEPASTTTAAPASTTTAAPASTTSAAPPATTSAAPAATTTAAPTTSTTAAPSASTTEPNASTTAAPAASTTAPSGSTTAAPASTTTAAPTAPSFVAGSVVVKIDPDDGTPQNPDSYQVSSDSSLTLSWQTANATRVNVDLVGDQAASGEIAIPTKDAIYTLTALAADGTSSQPVTVAISTHDANSVVSSHADVSSGIAKIVSLSATSGDASVTSVAQGAAFAITVICSDSTDAATINGTAVALTENSDGQKTGTLQISSADPKQTSFDCQVSAGGTAGDEQSIEIAVIPTSTTSAPTTTTAPGTTTTAAPASTTTAPGSTTTAAPASTSTLAPSTSTTISEAAAAPAPPAPPPGESTTHAPSATTSQALPPPPVPPGGSTTLAPSATTSHAPVPSTTAAPSPATTAAPTPATTHAPSSATTKAPTTLTLAWSIASGFCGDKVHLTGTTTLPDGPIQITLTALQGTSPKLTPITVTVASGAFDQEWEISNVDFGPAASALQTVNVQASAAPATATTITPANLQVIARSMAIDELSFDQQRTWSGFGCHTRFKQKQTGFTQTVTVTLPIMQAWGATYINLNSAGVTGTAGGCPWAGYRWARSTSPISMSPNEYYNGTAWVPMPTGFVVNNTVFQGLAFYKNGSTWACPQGGTYPTAFADYDFNATAYTTRRTAWTNDTNTRWSGAFPLRRVACKSDPSVNCCRYEVQVNVVYSLVTTYSADVILMAPENMRSNATLWFMGDSRLTVAAHETGHIMDNPDEYTGGAVDPTITGDGATSGIDADSIMGQNMTNVKKRHYHAFAEMAAKLINGKYTLTETYAAIDR